MKIKDVSIVPGCISCGTCEFVCPQVFEIKEVAFVNKKAAYNEYTREIDEASELCPVGVIKVIKE